MIRSNRELLGGTRSQESEREVTTSVGRVSEGSECRRKSLKTDQTEGASRVQTKGP